MARRPSFRVSAFLSFAAAAWLCAPAAVHARPFPAATLQAPAAAQAVQASPVLARLQQVPGVLDVKPLPQGPRVPADSYDLTFEQAVDHRNPSGAKFQQHVFLTHVGFDRPVLLGTEGYVARGPAGGELQRMLGSNTVTVEHRYFGRSVPSPLDWTYLTVRQSADDLHAVFAALKAVYPGKWVSTGASKGGQTSLFYKCYYPEDMDAVVAYVAPVNLAQEDPRANRLMETIGDEASRKRLRDFQLAMFDREDEVLPLVKAEADKKKLTFGLGLAAAYEYGVLEHPYAFWQYGTSPSEIPAQDAPAEVLAAHYNKVGALYYYSDQGKKQFEPFMYQAFVEIGYYNYDTTPFTGHMKALKNPTNAVLCPDGAKIVYDPTTMAFVYDFLRYKADRVIYIYGELDMWSSTQMQLLGRTDAVKFLVAGAHHGAHVANFSPEQKEQFYSTMERWLGMKLTRS
jgi:hypothetical protein